MPDWTGGATGALGGASTGFSIGGPVGGVVGGFLGGAAGLFGGGRKKPKKRSTMDKQQKKLYNLEHQGLLGEGPLADLYNYNPDMANDVFTKNYANPAYRDFKEKLAPEITGQFRSQGLMNSSYAGDALSRLARDIQEGLDAKRSDYLYKQEQGARDAKRNSINEIQKRSTFAYDTAAQGGGFDINKVLDSVTPEMIDQGKKWFNSQIY